MNEFKDTTKPMLKEIALLRQQNKKLKETRDLLLLKFISGKNDLEEIKV